MQVRSNPCPTPRTVPRVGVNDALCSIEPRHACDRREPLVPSRLWSTEGPHGGSRPLLLVVIQVNFLNRHLICSRILCLLLEAQMLQILVNFSDFLNFFNHSSV